MMVRLKPDTTFSGYGYDVLRLWRPVENGPNTGNAIRPLDAIRIRIRKR